MWIYWWRWRESNPRPKAIPPKRLQFSPLNHLTWLQSMNNFTPSDSLYFRDYCQDSSNHYPIFMILSKNYRHIR